jgi:hypothetical protein
MNLNVALIGRANQSQYYRGTATAAAMLKFCDDLFKVLLDRAFDKRLLVEGASGCAAHLTRGLAMKLIEVGQQMLRFVSDAVQGIFAPSSDHYPATGIQPFEGEPNHPSHWTD